MKNVDYAGTFLVAYYEHGYLVARYARIAQNREQAPSSQMRGSLRIESRRLAVSGSAAIASVCKASELQARRNRRASSESL